MRPIRPRAPDGSDQRHATSLEDLVEWSADHVGIGFVAADEPSQGGTTDDTHALSDAAALVPTGGSLFLRPGTYLVRALRVHGIRLFAVPGTVTLKLRKLASLDGSPIVDVTAAGARFFGISFDGNKDEQLPDGFSDSYDTGGNNTGRAFRCAIRMKDTGAFWSGLSVRQCRFINTYGAAVATSNVSQVEVDRCSAHRCNFELAFIHSENPGEYFTTGHRVTRNRMSNTGSGHATVQANGIAILSASDWICANNRVNRVERNGVKAEWPLRAAIDDNEIRSNSAANFGGIQLQSECIDTVVRNNRIYDCGAGINVNPTRPSQRVSNVKIAKNVVYKTRGPITGDGITVGQGALDRVSITDNVLRDIRRNSIYIVSGAASREIKISGNNARPRRSEAGGGILLQAHGGNWTDVSVSHNRVDHGTVAANSALIEFSSTDGSKMDAVVCTGNEVITKAGSLAIREAAAAIVTSGVFDNNVTSGSVALLGDWKVGQSNVITNTLSTFTHPEKAGRP